MVAGPIRVSENFNSHFSRFEIIALKEANCTTFPFEGDADVFMAG
jgi:hypothetical protein